MIVTFAAVFVSNLSLGLYSALRTFQLSGMSTDRAVRKTVRHFAVCGAMVGLALGLQALAGRVGGVWPYGAALVVFAVLGLILTRFAVQSTLGEIKATNGGATSGAH
jgi:hypothetical protein